MTVEVEEVAVDDRISLFAAHHPVARTALHVVVDVVAGDPDAPSHVLTVGSVAELYASPRPPKNFVIFDGNPIYAANCDTVSFIAAVRRVSSVVVIAAQPE